MSVVIDHIYEFGPYRVDTSQRLLTRDGKPVALTPKAFETLLALIESSGRVVKKDDLMKRVWPDAVVEEANLARHVYALRKALGDDNGEPVYIETIPKLGYRFVSSVTEIPAGETSSQPRWTATPMAHRDLAILVLIVLAIVSVTAVGLARFWRDPSPPATGDSGPVFLTNAAQDDSAAYWTYGGRIYFSRAVTNTRVESWTMDADGRNQHRANTEIKTLLHGRWSPDGRKVVFTKETDAHPIVYLANADGSDETALPFLPGNLDWSPDGSRLVYQAKTSPTVADIFLYTLATRKSVNLTKGVSSADPSFSSDGRQIAITSWRDGNAEIYVMDADGSNVRRLTNHPAFDQYPVFSPDGTQVAFQSNREDERIEVYLQNLNDGSPPRRLTKSAGITGLFPKCWSSDGTRMLVFTNRNGHDQIEVIAVAPFPGEVLLGDPAADLSFPRLSADGKRLLHEAKLADGRFDLRVTDLNTRTSRTLFKTERDYPISFHLEPAWSPDRTQIAFSARAAGNSEIFVVNADGTGLRNLTNNPLLDSSPVFSPDGTHIVFARDTYGQAQLFQMDLQGNGQHRLTGKPGYEMSPAFSPDGRHLAFAGDRQAHGLDIFLLDVNRPDDETVLAARPSPDTAPVFSPDGKRVAFIATSDGNPEIYLMNADGTGLFRVTHTMDEEGAVSFSNDGRQILFSSNRGGRSAIYRVQLQ
jgi:TolB protein